MQYAAHFPSARDLLVPVVALAIGAAGAVGVYSVLDETDVSVQPTRVVVTEPVQPGAGTSAKNEAGAAAAVAGSPVTQSFGKDEAASAAAIGGSPLSQSSIGEDDASSAARPGGGPPAESNSAREDAETARRTDPHGPATANLP
jgi:hypothetical protein